jgi:hypothetical protein
MQFKYFRVLATLFVVINLVGQLGSVAMVLTRFKVDIACCVLFFIVVLQVCNYDDRDSVCCGSGMFIPDPNVLHPGSEFCRIMFFYPSRI